MTMDRPVEYLVSLVRELCKLTGETEWVEFKVNVHEPQEIGEYVSMFPTSGLPGFDSSVLQVGVDAGGAEGSLRVRPLRGALRGGRP